MLMFLAEERSHPHGSTRSDLATGLELSKSTVLRLIAPLRDVRLVDQDPESGRYRLGPQNALLGQAYLERRDTRQITSPDRLLVELDLIRRRGYAVDDMENEQDIRCVAAPVHDHTGAVTTAVSISGPAARVTRERVAGLGIRLISATRTMTEDLGGTAPEPSQG